MSLSAGNYQGTRSQEKALQILTWSTVWYVHLNAQHSKATKHMRQRQAKKGTGISCRTTHCVLLHTLSCNFLCALQLSLCTCCLFLVLQGKELLMWDLLQCEKHCWTARIYTHIPFIFCAFCPPYCTSHLETSMLCIPHSTKDIGILRIPPQPKVIPPFDLIVCQIQELFAIIA